MLDKKSTRKTLFLPGQLPLLPATQSVLFHVPLRAFPFVCYCTAAPEFTEGVSSAVCLFPKLFHWGMLLLGISRM